MKRFTIFLVALFTGALAMQLMAQPAKARRPELYSQLPETFEQVGQSKMYSSIERRWFAGVSRLFSSNGPGYQYGISLLGEIDGLYYASTYGDNEQDDGCGSGFLAAFQVGNNTAVYLNSKTGTTDHNVTMTARVEEAGELATRIVYTLTNNNNQAVTINAGVYGDIMIGINDYAPLQRLLHNGETYGMKMKESQEPNAPLFCALFGEGVTGVTPADDYWFGQYTHNFKTNEIVGNYTKYIDNHLIIADDEDPNYMEENGDYDSALGFCWKNRTIPAGESIELSYLISIGEVEYEEPFVPGDDRFEYEVKAFDFEGWNDLSVAHPANVSGYYEHPYGQEGYIEYQVDDENTWHRIPTTLVSGENFDLDFDMLFDQARTTDHVLALRFNDGLDNITEMNGLSWTDVRSIAITGLEDRVYNGEPQIYEVTVGDAEPITIGEDGAYIYPGTYSYGIEGVFADNTIGVNEVEFNITKAESNLVVTVPEDCVWDGNGHPATAQLTAGDGTIVITYVNTETGETTTEAPVEPGTYEVWVEVTNSQYYNDIENTNYGTFTIDKAQSRITYTIPEDCLYDGEAHAATVELVEGDGELTVVYKKVTRDVTTEAPVEPGTYEVIASVTETDHYYGIPETVLGSFTIGKLQSEVEAEIPADCIYDGEEHPATVVLVAGDGDLTVTYKNTETGETTTDAPVEPGTYQVIVEVTEGEHYLGIEETVVGTFTIDKAQSKYECTVPENVEHDGQGHPATAQLIEGDGELTVYYKNAGTGEILTEAPVEVGTYEVYVNVTETDHYYGIDNEYVGTFTITEKATGINEMIMGNDDNGAWYTIDGRRVAAPTQPGIYIHNGKKYYVK